MATVMFTKEVYRLALLSKKECIQDLMNKDRFASDEGYQSALQAEMDAIDQELANYKMCNRSKTKNNKPRTLNAYNHFVKAKLPEIGKEHPEMDNRARMKHVSELWKAMSPEEKTAFVH